MIFCIRFLAKEQAINPEDILAKPVVTVSTLATEVCAETNATLLLRQTHSTTGIIATQENLVKLIPARTAEGDFLITRLQNITLGVMTGDCLPVLIVDPVQQVIAAIHAGWRGSSQGIVLKVIDKLEAEFGSHITDLEIYLGPSARSCCYEVDEPFVEQFHAAHAATSCIETRNNKLYFDNASFVTEQLLNAGLNRMQINSSSALCTICNPQFCSYRREKENPARQLSLICMHP